ncbi:thioredoxin domain protein (plasmid) [Natrialba magadii ATCC 43099]|uniref:DSBA oxidoreductase n=1 Tax=Natrialba magadii (strain ATCC 43099 / DSM 3394 / CCM 3739 / CIP 104546 / IAM 13178 / JCM 8861 / NBRC 102185 / NCIMB 2190 / MS3) TaxID=547559 RepID=D3T100_NATMM|nr:thioredoxin domain-containing protein [Natrialba magadii]ADD07259.1 thioredoxin domain protein [Natrialba magadii ATCC 43099]ELY34369.1 DSBA oxidoreductase [Natrialba magadii ATCC 43099]
MPLNTPSRRAVLAGSVLALGGGSTYYLFQSRTDATHDLSPTLHASEDTSALGVDLAGKPTMGSPAAPLEIYYWTDFQCPYCEQFERETLPDLVADYTDSGDVRIVFIMLPLFGSDSMTAAVASRCVWEQIRESDPDSYWDWHAAVFDAQDERNSGWAGTDNLLEITESVPAVDADALATCLEQDRSRIEDAVEADAAQAQSFGIHSTPTFVVFDPETEAAGTLVGAQPNERFDDAIEQIRTA